MLPLTRSRNRSRFFGIPFSPSSLFAAGEQGAWYDPSDYSTLFQDSAGTTPVTAVEQFVGLMLDKSKGLVLGSELVTNGDFSAGTTGWTLGDGTVAITGGALVFTSSTSLATNAATTYVSGKTYRVTFTITNRTAGGIVMQLSNGATAPSVTSPSFVANGTYTVFLLSNGNTTLRVITQGTTSLTVDNISVRELPGNHAFQTTSAKRPKLAARYNLLTRTEEFDNGYWYKESSTVTPNVASPLAPNGTQTVDAVFESAATGSHGIQKSVAVTSGVNYTYTVVVGSLGGREGAVVRFGNGSTDSSPGTFIGAATLGSFTTGVSSFSSGGLVSASCVALGNGLFRITATVTTTAATLNVAVWSWDGSAVTFTGDITKGLFVWGADLRPASQATGLIGPTYQRVAAATVYDTAGFLPYLAFDGLSWSMSTNSIDLTGVATVNVFAGVRKLSDASRGIVVDHLDNVLIINGFNLNAPGSSTDQFQVRSFSITSAANAEVTTGFGAPITVVASGITSITQDVSILRLNGSQVASNTADQGVGGYGNNILSIGARDNASLFFNGWLTSLIVRGAQSTQSQIEATEAWVNGKTGAY